MLNLYSSDHIIKILKKNGYLFVSQRGSHAKFRKKNGKKKTVIVPTGRKKIPYGTFRSILRQAGLVESDFS